MDVSTIRVQLAFGAKARGELYDIIANFVEDGMPVFEAISEVNKRLEQEKSAVAIVTQGVLRAMRGRSGQAMTVGQALAHWVDPVEAMIIDAGGQAGKVDEGFRMAKRLCDTTMRVRNTIMAEAAYPLALLVMFLAYLVMVGTVIVPVLTDILPRNKWPADARMLGWLGDNSILISSALAGIGVLVTVAFIYSRGRWIGPSRDKFDAYVFPWSVACSVKGAMLLSSISVMLKAGVPFDTILHQLGGAAGHWEKYQLGRMRAGLRAARPQGEALASEMFAKAIRWQIELYGRMNNFAEAIDRLSHRVVEQVLAKVKGSFGFFRFTVMLLVAGMIVWTYGTFLSLTMAARSAVGGG
jgi:type II secretory pathway component PulF